MDAPIKPYYRKLPSLVARTNHSILWAILHGALSWLYVIYFALTR